MGACSSAMQDDVDFKKKPHKSPLIADQKWEKRKESSIYAGFWKRDGLRKPFDEAGTVQKRTHLFRSSPVFLKRHSLPDRYDEEEELIYLQNEEAKNMSVSIRSENAAGLGGKPRWVLYRKYKEKKRDLSPPYGRTSDPTTRLCSCESRGRPICSSPDPQKRFSFPLYIKPVHFPAAFSGRRKLHVRPVSKQSNKCPETKRAENVKCRLRNISTSSEPSLIGEKRKRPTKIIVSFEEIRRERKLPNADIGQVEVERTLSFLLTLKPKKLSLSAFNQNL